MLRARSITRAFGARVVLDAIDLDLRADDRVGLVGRNGEGKTTLLRILCGLDVPDSGSVEPVRGARVALLRQEVDPSAGRNLIDEVRTAQAPLLQLERDIGELEREIARAGDAVEPTLAERYDRARTEFERKGGYQAEAKLRGTLAGLGFPEERWDRPLSELSGGWLMRVELAKLLLAQPEVLLLDEPTNHLDLPSIGWFEGTLEDYPGAVLVVSHDRHFLDRHARRIAELDRGRLTLYTGNYSAYELQRAERLRLEEARRKNIDAKITQAQRFVDRFGAKATKAAQARSRKKQIERLQSERPEEETSARGMKLRFPPSQRSGDLVLRLEDVHMAYGEHVVYDGLSLELRRGDRVALTGPNGAGKSTLLRLVAGALAPQHGDREVGHNVALGFYAQHQLESLDPGRSVYEELDAAAPGHNPSWLRTLLGAFLFTGDDVEKRVSVLSGGEKARLALACLLVRGANLLVLDEPTNHLDMSARAVLAEALAAYDGSLVLISHDRTFINTLANKVWDVVPGAGCSSVNTYPGNYDDYLAVTHPEEAPDPSPRNGHPRASRAGSDHARRRGERRAAERRVRQLEATVTRLEGEIVSAERELQHVGLESADPAIARDGERMRELALRQRTLSERVPELYSEWEARSSELEEARSALAG